MRNESQTALRAAELWQELANVWRQMPDKGLFLGLLAAWIALFQFWGNSTFGFVDTPSLFGWMHYVYRGSEDDSHGFFVPFIVLGLLGWKRKELLEVPKRAWWPAMGLMVLAAWFHIVGYLVQQTRLSIVAFFLGMYGLTGLVWGRRWLQATFFPMFLLLFCVPLGTMADTLTLPLRLLVSKIAVFLSHSILGISVQQDGVQIFSPSGSYGYEVAAACSGIRSLAALLGITTVYGFCAFKSPWKRLLMMAAAFPLAVVGNVARLMGVIVVAEAFGQRAGAYVETKFGFVTFVVVIACVLVLGRWLEARKPAAMTAWESKTA